MLPPEAAVTGDTSPASSPATAKPEALPNKRRHLPFRRLDRRSPGEAPPQPFRLHYRPSPTYTCALTFSFLHLPLSHKGTNCLTHRTIAPSITPLITFPPLLPSLPIPPLAYGWGGKGAYKPPMLSLSSHMNAYSAPHLGIVLCTSLLSGAPDFS